MTDIQEIPMFEKFSPPEGSGKKYQFIGEVTMTATDPCEGWDPLFTATLNPHGTIHQVYWSMNGFEIPTGSLACKGRTFACYQELYGEFKLFLMEEDLFLIKSGYRD